MPPDTMSGTFKIRVSPIPVWLDWRRLLGPGAWKTTEHPDGHLEAETTLDRNAVADLSARLRGVGIGGSLLSVEIAPKLHRRDVRRASTDEARRYRERTPGFTRPAVRLDEVTRLSLTPEALALKLGERARGLRVIDACTGAGGNAIGFARAGCSVVAIEINQDRLAMAQHNAGVYGVAHRIKFICGDACVMVPQHQADLLFIDPPWGERYDKERVALSDLPPCEKLLECGRHVSTHWVKVPPSFDPSTLPGCHIEAIFGVAAGDERRVKFLLLERKNV